MIYLLHSTVPLHRAGTVAVQHYLGYCDDDRLDLRLAEHRSGRSKVAIVRAFNEKGADLVLVKTWPGGTQALERYLKRNGHISKHCPLCRRLHLNQIKASHKRSKLKLSLSYSEALALPSTRPEKRNGGASSAHSTTTVTSRSGLSHREPLQENTTLCGAYRCDPDGGGTCLAATVPPSKQVGT